MAEGTETRMNWIDSNNRLQYSDRSGDQPKKQELPPLDGGLVDFPQKDNASDVLNQVAIKLCRERQLLAALSDNEAKAARIAELERRAEYADTLYRGQAERDGVRIAELEGELAEARSGNVAWESAVGGLEAHLQDRVAMGDPADPQRYLEILRADVQDVRRDTEDIRKATWARERMYCANAEASEAKLKSVEGMLKEKLASFAATYQKADVDALLAKLRAIVEGK